MLRVAVNDVLRTGRFGPFRAGSTMTDVRAAIGEPDHWKWFNRKRTQMVAQYGHVVRGSNGGKASAATFGRLPSLGSPSA